MLCTKKTFIIGIDLLWLLPLIQANTRQKVNQDAQRYTRQYISKELWSQIPKVVQEIFLKDKNKNGQNKVSKIER